MGYHRAGFDVTGVDLVDQPRYPFRFVQGDALEYLAQHAHEFDALAASPPCQHYANVTAWRGDQADHPDLIGPTRELLEQTGLPWVMENVRTKALRPCLMLCGTAFGLSVRRHRYFETNWNGGLMLSNPCQHRSDDFSFDHGSKQPESVYRDAMGCGWMTVRESREAIPPSYTAHIGSYLKAHIETATREAA